MMDEDIKAGRDTQLDEAIVLLTMAKYARRIPAMQ